MQYLFMILLVAGATALDQWTKYLVVENIPLYGHVEFIPDFLSFTYVQNTGAAFSSFQGMRWMFVAIFVILTAALLFEYFKKPMGFIAAIYAGGLGNMIDRLRLGYVVDMIKTEFMTFPVFNVADCFITCGCILLLVHLFFFNKEFWKDDKKK